MKIKPMAKAPKNRPILAKGPTWPYPAVIKWEKYDKDDAAELGKPGFWCFAENLLSEVTEDANDATHFCELPQFPEEPTASPKE